MYAGSLHADGGRACRARGGVGLAESACAARALVGRPGARGCLRRVHAARTAMGPPCCARGNSFGRATCRASTGAAGDSAGVGRGRSSRVGKTTSMKDLTQGSITRHLVELSSFLAVSMLLQTLYFLVDLYFVSGLGGPAIA